MTAISRAECAKEPLSFSWAFTLSPNWQRVMHVALVALFGTTGGFALILEGVSNFIAFPLFATAAFFANRFFSIQDYANPRHIETYKQQAKATSFEKTLARHGLGNILSFALIPEETLASELKVYLKDKHPIEIASLHCEVLAFQRAHNTYTPSPLTSLFKDAMRTSMAPYRPVEMFEWEDYSIITSCRLISRELLDARMRYIEAKTAFHRDTIDAKETFIARLKGKIDFLYELVEGTSSSHLEGQRWISTIKEDLRTLQKTFKLLDQFHPSNFTVLRNPEGHWDDIRELHAEQKVLVVEFAAAKEEYLQSLAQVRLTYQQTLDAIDAEFS